MIEYLKEPQAIAPDATHRPPCAEGTGSPCDFGSQPFLSLETGHGIVPHVEIHRCQACGHSVTMPAMADVAPLYAARKSDDFLRRDTRWIKMLKNQAFLRTARQLLRKSVGEPRVVADFGTGNGMLAQCLARVAGEGTKVYGLDFFEDAPGDMGQAAYLSFAASPTLATKVDLLTCFHVLEHDDDSDAFLRRLIELLAPQGTMVIEVPNVDCVWTPWFGRSCANWYVPFHRVHFSRASLHALITRHDLQIVEERDICGPTFALSLAAWLGTKPNSIIFAAAVALRPLQWLAETLTRRPSALRIVARRH